MSTPSTPSDSVSARELAGALFSLAPPPKPTAKPSFEVKAETVQEIILATLADLQVRAISGEFGRDEAQVMKQMVEFAKEFSSIARAVQDVADYGRAQTAQAEIETPKHVSETVARLRATMKKPAAAK